MAGVEDLAKTVAELQARVHDLEAAEAIRNLKARYAELVDERYAKGRPRPAAEVEPLAREIAALFTEDAVWDGGGSLGECVGREAIYRRFAEPTLHFSWHYFVKPRIEVDGDRARASWDILAPCTTPDDRAQWMSGVEYDEYARVDGRWLHTRMKLRVVFMAPYDQGWVRRRG